MCRKSLWREGSFGPCCMVGTGATMAIRGHLSIAHVSDWVLQPRLQFFLRPCHATFSCTKTHMAYYSIQRIWMSLVVSLSHTELSITCFLLLLCIFSSASHPLALQQATWEGFFVLLSVCSFVMSH